MQSTRVVPSPMQALLMIAIVVAALLHLTTTLSLGFISDDFLLMKSAREGTQLWHLHYAPLMEYLWQLTVQGRMSAMSWHFITLSAHTLNVFLLFHIGRRAFALSFHAALFATVLFAFIPIGLEALTWISASGYPLMTTGLLGGIVLLLELERQHESRYGCLLVALALTILQATTFLTWDWAILIAPIFAFFALLATTLPKRKLPLLLGPALALWACAALLRVTSKYGNAWQHNDLSSMTKFAVGSPLLTLLPNINKGWFITPVGATAALLLFGMLLLLALRHRSAMAGLLAYYLSIAPWIIGGNPSSRYFYFPAAFLYLLIAFGIETIRQRFIRQAAMIALTLLTIYFCIERLYLWKGAEEEAQKLRHHIQHVANRQHPDTPLIIVNLPDAYGPPTLPLRPQMWYCGFDAVIPGIKVIKTDDCSFIWEKDPNRIARNEVSELFKKANIYEVVLETKEQQNTFHLVPFSD